VLGASSYTYAEATWTRNLWDWCGSHVRAFEFFAGTSRLIVLDFVPGNKIQVLWRIALCGRRAREPRQFRRRAWITEHNSHSDSSHFTRSSSLRHPRAERHSAETSTGGRHAATAACLVRSVISA